MNTGQTMSGAWVFTESCPRCGGRGFIPRYGHVHKGTCFQCNGSASIIISGRRTAQIVNSIHRAITGKRARQARNHAGNTDTTESRALGACA